ncbi:MAG: metallophosphoesterase family protein [Myxococcales bacterium]|nr:metallophosphoesterase family protein [Myxococcales bacterium]
MLLGTVALSTACSEDGSKKPSASTPVSFPYTPEGCAYTVSPPELADVAMSSNATGGEPAPKHVHLSWAGPADSTFAVNWATDLDTKLTQVLYGPDKAEVEAAEGAGGKVKRQLGHTMQLGSPLFLDQKLRVHETHVCGLAANTTVYYKVGGPGAWSRVFDVATAPARGATDKFKFTVSGDSRSGADIFAKIQEQAAAQGIDFQIFTGDFIDNTTNQSHWEALFEGKTGAYSTEDMLATRPLMPVNGNHDNLSVYYLGQFALPQELSPGEGAQGEAWYSFDYGNAHFLMLDSEAAKLDAQADFMREDVKKVDRAKTPWLFAVFHTTPYTCGSKHQGDSLAPRATWQPVFDELKVDVVLAGHVHNYQRSVPIRGFAPGTTDGVEAASGPKKIPVNESGTVYVVSGGASGDLYGVDPPTSCPSFAYLTEKVNHSLTLEVEDRTLRYKALRLDGTELDSFEYTK